NVHRMEGRTDEADALFGRSIELLRGLAAGGADADLHREKLAQALRDHAYLQQKLGRLQAATASLEEAIQIATPLAEADPQNRDYQRPGAAAVLALASVQYSRAGQRAQAGKTAQEAVTLFEPLAQQPEGQRHPYDPLLLAAALNLRAVTER